MDNTIEDVIINGQSVNTLKVGDQTIKVNTLNSPSLTSGNNVVTYPSTHTSAPWATTNWTSIGPSPTITNSYDEVNDLKSRLLDVESENYALKEELKDLRETVKLIGDSLIEYVDEHEVKKRGHKKNKKVVKK